MQWNLEIGRDWPCSTEGVGQGFLPFWLMFHLPRYSAHQLSVAPAPCKDNTLNPDEDVFSLLKTVDTGQRVIYVMVKLVKMMRMVSAA